MLSRVTWDDEEGFSNISALMPIALRCSRDTILAGTRTQRAVARTLAWSGPTMGSTHHCFFFTVSLVKCILQEVHESFCKVLTVNKVPSGQRVCKPTVIA